MVTSIGGTNLAHKLPVGLDNRKTETAVAVPAATTQALEGSAATVPSAEAAAAARVGGQLDAQFDASRLQRAQDETPVDTAGTEGAATAESAEAEASGTNAAAAAPAGGGARMGGAAGSSDSESADYIAEADTNNDRKVSEQERIAYAKKQASEAQQSREQEVRQAYLPQETAGVQLDISA